MCALIVWATDRSLSRPSTSGSIRMRSAWSRARSLVSRERSEGTPLNQDPTQFCHYGDAGQGILEGPGFKNVDFSLMKNIELSGNARLQFRWEIFNLFNTPQFGVPNSVLNGSAAFLPSAAGGAFPTQVTPSRGPGSISTLVAPMRQMQFGLKVLF